MMASGSNAGDTVDVDLDELEEFPSQASHRDSLASAGVSLPSAEEVRNSEVIVHGPLSSAQSKRSKCRWIIVGTVVVLVLVLIIGLAVGLSREDGGSRNSTPDEVIEYLAENGVSDRTDLATTGTPQSNAANWMAKFDKADLPVPEDDIDSFEGYYYMTRYVLALNYYALSGWDWYPIDWGSDKENCYWNSFNPVSRDANGVFCDEDGYIIQLTLDQQNMTGEIPAREIGMLTTLTTLDFSWNDLTGEFPEELCQLTNLEVLGLGFVGLEGYIPDCLFTLTTLDTLDLFGNDLDGTIPDDFCELTNLVQLDIETSFTSEGPIPECFADDLTELEVLFLNNNFLTGEVPDLGELSNLAILMLSNNLLSGEVPESFADLTQLAALGLDTNDFEGDVTELFVNMPNLQLLFLEDNNFSGEISDSVWSLQDNPSLSQLDASRNDFTGTIPAHLLNHPTLQILDLHSNDISGQFPQPIEENNNALLWLGLQNNDMTGPVPEDISNLDELWYLDISTNNFVGDIPAQLGELTQLRYLFVGNNDFDAGPIPESIAGMTWLRDLSLKSANRTGGIPPVFGDWTQLTLLDLDDNALDGNIPSELGRLFKLQYLLLNDNMLVGDVPQEIQRLPFLRLLFLDGNDLTGNLTTLCTFSSFNEANAAWDPVRNVQHNESLSADCDEIDCPCCDLCCSDDDDEECHEYDLVPGFDGNWEGFYGRSSYQFGPNSTYDHIPVRR